MAKHVYVYFGPSASAEDKAAGYGIVRKVVSDIADKNFSETNGDGVQIGKWIEVSDETEVNTNFGYNGSSFIVDYRNDAKLETLYNSDNDVKSYNIPTV